MKIGETTTAVVTGAAGGLGRAIALELSRRGARLLLTDIDEKGVGATAEEIRRRGGRAESMRCDVAKLEEQEAVAARSDELFGRTDLLVNNAGVAASGLLGEMPLDDWRWVMGINLWGPIYGCHLWVPRMKRAGSGHILNVASIAGVASAPLMGPYNVTKAGVIALSETLAAEVEREGIGVTALCPFFFQTNVLGASRQTGDTAMVGVAAKLMRDSKLTADDVASIGLDACERGTLYCMPHLEAKAIWGLKRLTGERFRKLAALLQRRYER